MKKLIFSMLAMAAMVSCSNEGDPINEVNPPVDGEKVEIKINAGVVGVETKAPVTAWDTNTGTEVQFAMGTSTGSYSADWYATITGTGGTIQFKEDDAYAENKSYYYDQDGTVSTFLIGFYPKATRTNNNVVYTIPAAGSDDIMVSDEQSGNKVTTMPELTFSHLLTQLKFKVAAKTGFPADYVVKSIILKGTKRTATLDLSVKTLIFTSLAEGDDITVLSNGTISIATTAEDAGEPIMVQPEQTMTLDIVAGLSGNSNADRTYTDIAFKTAGENSQEEAAKAGKAYTVALSFSDKEVVATASLTEWDNTGTGSGDVM